MPSFNAGSLVEALDYSFQPFHQDSGTVPEPSDKQIGAFLSGLKTLFSEASSLAALAELDQNDPAAMLDALNSLDGDDFVNLMASMCEVFGALCSGKPSAATLKKVPVRPRRLFFEWIQQEVLSPEAAPAAGMQPVPIRPQAVGG